jgi:hypothetical protein
MDRCVAEYILMAMELYCNEFPDVVEWKCENNMLYGYGVNGMFVTAISIKILERDYESATRRTC